MLATLLLIPLITAACVVAAPARLARGLALAGTAVTLVVAVLAAAAFDFAAPEAMQLESTRPWLPALGLEFALGTDGVSLLLVLLTAGLMPLVVLGSTSAVRERVRTFHAWLLVLEAAMLGVFLARDLVLFYVCFEFTLLPMYFLIAIFGSANRARASIVFFLYTFAGSMITLAGLLFVAWHHWAATGTWTFSIPALVESAARMSPGQQGWVLLALCCGFAVKVPLFPVHTWLPLAHTEAPTAGSVILAAVLLKLGTYGLLRFALPMCPIAIVEYAPVLATLCVIGILYGALVCWVQRDMKRLVAYSSVSHLGFCVLGLVALTPLGITGSVAYMINHGLSTGALFLCIGMIYERYHTRSMDELGGLGRRMPVWSFFMIFFVMASVGLPGLNGFVGEFLALAGTFTSGRTVDGVLQPGNLGPAWAAVAGIGMILAAVYLLHLAGRVVFGPVRLPDPETSGGHHATPALPRDLTVREIAVLTPLAAACLVLGLKPGLVLDPVRPQAERLAATFVVTAPPTADATAADDDEATPVLSSLESARKDSGDE